MSTAVPERGSKRLTDEQVIELDRLYPHTVGCAMLYGTWIFFVSAGGVLVVEMLFSFLENGIAYWVFIGSAVGGTVGAYLSRHLRRVFHTCRPADVVTSSEPDQSP